MRGSRAVLAMTAVAMVLAIAASFAMVNSLKARNGRGRAADDSAPQRRERKKGPPAKFRTLGDLMAKNYGWKPPDAAAPAAKPGAAPTLPSAPTAADPEALRKAVDGDDVCAVDRLTARAGKDAAVAAFLEPGQSRMLGAAEEDALRALLDPKARAAQAQANGGALQGLRFLDALEQARLLRLPGGAASAGNPVDGWHALDDLASEDRSNAAYAFFAAPAQIAAGRDIRDVRYETARAFASARFDTGVPEIIELLAKQGLASASHLYLSTYLRASLPTPNWASPAGAAQRLLADGDEAFARTAYDLGQRLQQDALDRLGRSPATRRWNEAQLAAGRQLVDLSWRALGNGEAPPLPPDLPPPDGDDGASVLEAVRALGRGGALCDRDPMDRAVRDERARLRL